jgi:hypothetical protein
MTMKPALSQLGRCVPLLALIGLEVGFEKKGDSLRDIWVLETIRLPGLGGQIFRYIKDLCFKDTPTSVIFRTISVGSYFPKH